MKLGLVLGYAGKRIQIDMPPILEAERLGFDSVWTAEAYGSDAVGTAAWAPGSCRCRRARRRVPPAPPSP
jgi:hypothetical protein